MRIAVLSDFHIGASDATDGFRHDASAFQRFLDDIEKTHDTVVLLGDIYQCEQGLSLSRSQMQIQLDRARERTPWLSERIRRESYRYLHGNHDSIAKSALGAPSDLLIEEDSCRVYFVHGDRFDPILNRAAHLARMSTWFSGRLRMTPLRHLAHYLEYADVVLKDRRFGGPRGPYASGARLVATEHRADIVVMGHTHVPRKDALGDLILANSGTCSNQQHSWVSIDTSARTAQLHHR